MRRWYYPVEAAVKDAIFYHDACSLVAALEQTSLALKRMEDPGLKASERVLIRTKRLQKILNTPADEIHSLILPDEPLSALSLTSTADSFEFAEIRHPISLFQRHRLQIVGLTGKLGKALQTREFAPKTAGTAERKKTDAAGKPEPKKADAAAKPEPRKADAAAKPEPKKADAAAKPEPKKADAAAKPEPKKADAAAKPEPKKADAAAKPEPKNTDTAGKPETGYATPRSYSKLEFIGEIIEARRLRTKRICRSLPG